MVYLSTSLRILLLSSACSILFVSTSVINKPIKPICNENVIKSLSPGEKEEETFLEPFDFLAEDESEDSSAHCQNVPNQPELMANKFEGDIELPKTLNIKQFIKNSNQLARNAISSQWRLWRNGEIPYTISSRYGTFSRKILAKAMQSYTDETCVKFVPRDGERDYVHITPDDGCYSLVGRVGGRQIVSLDAGCIQFGTVVHELMHSVGFFHEQSRNDRDDWIEIIEKNVMAGAMDQFEKYSLRTISHLDTQYDYNSIMHYGPYAFSRNGMKTIHTRKSGGSRLGQRDGFSAIDIEKINKLYKCEDRTTKTVVLGPDNDDENEDTDNSEENGEQAECENTSWRCVFWSTSIFGYCESSDIVRNVVCRKACGVCDRNTAVSTCKDKNASCKKWENAGFCQRRSYRQFMKDKCPKSCQEC